ncbi:MAG: 7-cyano-7-deazaguanine synthase QueC [Puniceicoccales bacterium]|jgi:7-cyano-7-deazaguanine synthase|nr:7-cyano-7-deazaguanine synthase QueC [Puniceicoccales bacterium]
MKTAVVFSGGLDSTVLLAKLVSEGRECLALTFDYGQRHAREIESARAIAALLGIRHHVADLRALIPLWGSNSLTDHAVAVPDGHYTEERMKTTVVPGRNLVFLSVAAAWAIAEKCDSLAYGAHSGDHTIYPDCRPEFADALAAAVALADWRRVELERPFVTMDKAAVARLGAALGAPMALSWSCYKGGKLHCGRCATCVERREAFEKAAVPDPTDYET